MTGSEKPLRWLLLASHVPASGQGGGMVRYLVELAAALDRRPDIELSVCVASDAVAYFQRLLRAPERVHTLPALPTLGRALVERHTRRVDRGGPYDVLHGAKHLVPHRSSAAIRVLTVHDMMLHDRPQDFGPVKRTLLRRPYLASATDADLLVCVSEATRARLLSLLPSVSARSVVVPLAVSSALLDAAPQALPELVGRVFAVVVGDASYRKNLALLVDGWEQIRERVPEAILAIAGPSNWAGTSYGESFNRLTAAGSIVSLGRVSDEVLRWLYEHAAVALCPSLLEGFGLPAVEALAFQAPVITSTDAALVEASGPAATHLPPDRPDLWVNAIAAALAPGRESGPPYAPRTWDQVADDTVSAARNVLAEERVRDAKSPAHMRERWSRNSPPSGDHLRQG